MPHPPVIIESSAVGEGVRRGRRPRKEREWDGASWRAHGPSRLFNLLCARQASLVLAASLQALTERAMMLRLHYMNTTISGEALTYRMLLLLVLRVGLLPTTCRLWSTTRVSGQHTAAAMFPLNRSRRSPRRQSGRHGSVRYTPISIAESFCGVPS